MQNIKDYKTEMEFKENNKLRPDPVTKNQNGDKGLKEIKLKDFRYADHKAPIDVNSDIWDRMGDTFDGEQYN